MVLPNTVEQFNSSHDCTPKNCEECHEQHFYPGIMNNLTCNDCHSLLHNTPPACIDCHSNTTILSHDDPHSSFITDAQNSYILENDNEACYFCHNNIDVNYKYERPEFIEFEIVNNSGDWNIHNLNEGNVITDTIWVERDDKSHKWMKEECVGCHLDINTNVTRHYPLTCVHNACLDCHGKSSSEHTSKIVECSDVGCHINHVGNLIAEVNNQPVEYRGNMCLGCHGDGYSILNVGNGSTESFKVYLEVVC